METRQGKPLAPEKVAKIKKLLATTDMSTSDIAERMGCSRGRIGHINRKFGIRVFGNKRSTWVLNEQPER